MSANVEALKSEGMDLASMENALPQTERACDAPPWNANDFAREQIRALVRQVFFSGGARSINQVVFCAAQAHLDVTFICEKVARALAAETLSQVALVTQAPGPERLRSVGAHCKSAVPIQSWAGRMAINLWRVPKEGIGDREKESATGLRWLSRLAELRSEFEYSVIHGPDATISSEAALLGQMSDGIILVLGAHRTRRATARKIKEGLLTAQARILGTVLSERTFPMPEQIYRRL